LFAADSLRSSTRALTVAELLEVPQHKDLPVNSVHSVERFLKPLGALGSNGHFAGPGVLPEEARGKRGRARRRISPAVNRNLASGVAGLGPELFAMHELQSLECQEPQPEKRRHRIGLALVLSLPFDRLEKRLLNHVRRVDSSAQTLVQA
jgi:hypothetical protein